jgi:hypothetical protein
MRESQVLAGFSVRPVTADDGDFRSVRARIAHGQDPGSAAGATWEQRLGRLCGAENGHRRIVEVGQVPVAAHHRLGGRRLCKSEEVVVVRVPADRGAVRRIRDSVAAPGDLGDERSGPPGLANLRNLGRSSSSMSRR